MICKSTIRTNTGHSLTDIDDFMANYMRIKRRLGDSIFNTGTDKERTSKLIGLTSTAN